MLHYIQVYSVQCFRRMFIRGLEIVMSEMVEEEEHEVLARGHNGLHV